MRRYIYSGSLASLPTETYDTIIVGGGLAGIYTALNLPANARCLMLLKKDGQGLSHPGRQIGPLQTCGQRRRPAGPLLLHAPGHLARQVRRRGAGAPGVREDVHGSEGAPLHEGQGLGKLLLGLPGEAHDEIGGKTGGLKVSSQ